MAFLSGLCCTGCWGQRQLPYQTVSSGSIAGFGAPYGDVLEQLAGAPWAMIAACEQDWAPTRDVLNRGAGLKLYGFIDFGRYVVLAYFHGPAQSRGHRVEVQSLTLRGDRVQVRFRFVMSGRTTDIGYPYQIIALDKADLWGRTPAAEPRQFAFNVWEGRSEVKTIRVTLQPPGSGPDGTGLPALRILGSGIPQAWSPDGTEVLICGEDEATGQGMPGPGLFTVPAGGPGQARSVYIPDSGVAGIARYSPDGSKLAFAVASGSRLRLLLAAPKGGGPAPPVDLTPPGFDFGGGYAWSPDGGRLAVVGLLSVVGGQRHGLLIVPATGGGKGGDPVYAQEWRLSAPSWPRNGGGCIFFLRETSQGTVLTRLDLSSGTPADVVLACAYDLTGDGRWLAYLVETGPRERTLYVVELTRLLEQGSRGTAVAAGDISSPLISPDGGLVAYSITGAAADGGGPHVWVASAAGSWKSRLSTGAGARPVSFRPGGEGLLVELLPAPAAGETPATLAALFYLP